MAGFLDRFIRNLPGGGKRSAGHKTASRVEPGWRLPGNGSPGMRIRNDARLDTSQIEDRRKGGPPMHAFLAQQFDEMRRGQQPIAGGGDFLSTLMALLGDKKGKTVRWPQRR